MGTRQRAHSVGADLRADLRAPGGFEVATDLPLPTRAQAETLALAGRPEEAR